jgi:hypothetical protein
MGVIKMHEKLRDRIDALFENAPKTRRANELKEELLANLIDKYNDLIASGKSEDEAINSAIAGIGDVDELIMGMTENNVLNYKHIKKDQQRSALILSISIGMYIMSVVVLILCTGILGISGELSICIMLTMDAAATCLIIYNAISRPKYKKADDSMVEEFKEWKSATSEKNKILQSIKSIVWTLIVAFYLLMSFVFGIWAYSWIIFIIGVAIEKIITLTFELKEK